MYRITASTAAVWAGRILTGIVVIALVTDAMVNLAAPEKLAAEMASTGFPAELAAPLGVIMLVCAVVYAIPATSVLGAILVSAFAGGAISTHFRLEEMGSPPQIISALISVFAWAGLILRYPSLRALIPWVRRDSSR